MLLSLHAKIYLGLILAYTNSRQFEGVIRILLDNLQSQVSALEVSVVKDTLVEEAGSSISSPYLFLFKTFYSLTNGEKEKRENSWWELMDYEEEEQQKVSKKYYIIRGWIALFPSAKQ